MYMEEKMTLDEAKRLAQPGQQIYRAAYPNMLLKRSADPANLHHIDRIAKDWMVEIKKCND